ncbi:MAG: hypothetical protein HY593_04980 [Candidatus Omnitrophica bacterium]|nr:hypothetical protein [Candidatus Omnitrophota bacterium]
MKHQLVRIAAVGVVGLPLLLSAAGYSEEVFKTFYVYSDANVKTNHYTPSGWMGDYGDLKMNERHADNPQSGASCIQVVYNGKAAQGALWAGIYWQNPPNNWGAKQGGYDLTGAKKLTFWVRGQKGGERIEEFKVGGITGEYPDSDAAGIGPIVLTADWQELTIDLEGKDLSSISGGFAWTTNVDANPEGCAFYLDEIKYE